MSRQEIPQFLWISQDRTNQNWSLTIKGIDVRSRVLSGSKLSWGLIGEDLSCEIILENSDGSLLGEFSENDIIVFRMDLSGGIIKQFEGEVESVINQYENNSGYNLKIIGSHYTIRTVDVTANKDYTNSTISDIRKNLISTYMSGFTSNNVETNNKVISIKFINKPITDCMIDLNIQGEEDCFVDHDKDFHSFLKGSKTNENQALVIYDNMFNLKGLGVDNTTKRNKIKVSGEVGGIPVIHTSESTQTRVREKIVTDGSIVDELMAKDVADSELVKELNVDTEGVADCAFIPDLTPGYMTYIVSPDQGITAPYRLSKFDYKIPDESLEVQVSQRRTIAKLFKDRILKDLSQENIINPFDMTRSYVLTFDDESKIVSSSNYVIENGVIRKSTSVTPTIILTITKSSDINANSMSLLVVGSVIDGASFSFIADSLASFQSISPNSLSDTTVVTPGKNIQLKITITDNNTRIDTVGLYWR